MPEPMIRARNIITVFVPVSVKSLNRLLGRSWKASYFSGKALKLRTTTYLRAAGVNKLDGRRCVIRMTRLYGRRGKAMDNDNLRGALKPVRDAVATELGIDDADASQWPEPSQERVDDCEGVLIEIKQTK